MGQPSGSLGSYEPNGAFWYNWTGGADYYCMIGNNWQSPGINYDSVRAFQLPHAGPVFVGGLASDGNTGCSSTDGRQVRLLQNSNSLTPWVAVPYNTFNIPAQAATVAQSGDLRICQRSCLT